MSELPLYQYDQITLNMTREHVNSGELHISLIWYELAELVNDTIILKRSIDNICDLSETVQILIKDKSNYQTIISKIKNITLKNIRKDIKIMKNALANRRSNYVNIQFDGTINIGSITGINNSTSINRNIGKIFSNSVNRNIKNIYNN